MSKLVNLTPHTLNIHTRVGVVNVPPSGDEARVAQATREVGMLVEGGIPLFVTSYGEVTGLPAPREGVLYLVSGMVEAAVKRRDVFSPGELVRDENGKPIGCKGLKQSAKIY